MKAVYLLHGGPGGNPQELYPLANALINKLSERTGGDATILKRLNNCRLSPQSIEHPFWYCASGLAGNRPTPPIYITAPWQSAASVEGQVEELSSIIRWDTQNGNIGGESCKQHAPGKSPAASKTVLIGHSWGGWLAWLTAARYPELVDSLVLLSCGPFKASYATRIMPERLARMTQSDRGEYETIVQKLRNNDTSESEKKRFFSAFGRLFNRIDSFDALASEELFKDTVQRMAHLGNRSGGLTENRATAAKEMFQMTFHPEIYQSVWSEADRLRSAGELLKRGEKITCPVTAIHGDYDPHPAAGVVEPLQETISDFQFHLLENCGHRPWAERDPDVRQRCYDLMANTILNL